MKSGSIKHSGGASQDNHHSDASGGKPSHHLGIGCQPVVDDGTGTVSDVRQINGLEGTKDLKKTQKKIFQRF